MENTKAIGLYSFTTKVVVAMLETKPLASVQTMDIVRAVNRGLSIIKSTRETRRQLYRIGIDLVRSMQYDSAMGDAAMAKA